MSTHDLAAVAALEQATAYSTDPTKVLSSQLGVWDWRVSRPIERAGEDERNCRESCAAAWPAGVLRAETNVTSPCT